MEVSSKQGLANPEIHKLWWEKAGTHWTVAQKLGLSGHPAAIIAITLAVAAFFGLMCLPGFLSSHTGTYPDGTTFDHTASGLNMSYTMIALAGTTVAVGAVFLAIALKNRKEIANNPKLLEELIKKQELHDAQPEVLKMKRWEVAARTSPSVRDQLYDANTWLLISAGVLLLILSALIPAYASSGKYVNHCGAAPEVIDHTFTNHVVQQITTPLAGIALVAIIVLGARAYRKRKEIREDVDDRLLNRLIAQDCLSVPSMRDKGVEMAQQPAQQGV